MICIPGDFPSLLVLLTGIVGIFGIGAGALAGIIAGGLAAAGTTAYGIKTGIEGNWPWTDPEAWFTGYAKSLVSPVGEIISDVRGEPSINEQVKGVAGEIARGSGSGAAFQAATGNLGAKFSAEAQQARGAAPMGGGAGSQPQPMGGQFEGAGGGGGASRYDSMDAGEQGASRGKILGGAWKNIGIQAGIQAAASALPYAGSIIGPTVGAAAESIAPIIGETVGAAAPPLLAAAGPTAGELAASLTQPLAGTLLPSVAGAAPPLLSAAGPAAPSFISSSMDAARHALQIIPDTIGDTASGILQSGVYGAGKGALAAGLSSLGSDNRQSPGSAILQGALSGGAGGLVSGGFNAGMSPFASPSQYQMINSPMPSAIQAGWSPGAPSLGYMAGSQAASPLGGLASAGVNELMTPQPPQPPQPTYRRPTYADVYDIGGDRVPYASRPPWWG